MRRFARAVLVMVVFGGTGFADQTEAPGQQAQPGQTGSSDVDIMFRQQANLTPQEMITESDKSVDLMQRGLNRVLLLQEQARKQNDIIKLNCVNDKLVQIKAAINIGEQSRNDLREAIARNDEGARGHAFIKVTIATQKVQVLIQEAENCVGQDLSFIGETHVETEIDPNIPQEDPTEPPLPYPGTDRPPEASPFI
jgi:hypothetical protein